MQRVAPSSLPPRRQEGNNINGNEQGSPALHMASRIRAEQGPEKAAQYLAAMEPFLAPGERAHIAGVLGLPQFQQQPPQYAQPAYSQPQGFSQPSPPLGGAGPLGSLGNLGGLGNIGNIMQMMQLVNGMQGMFPSGAQGGGSPLAQMLGGLMGGKK